VGRLKHEALREEVHRFDEKKIPEIRAQKTGFVAVQLCGSRRANLSGSFFRQPSRPLRYKNARVIGGRRHHAK
jgi:hypothetical protein